MDFKVHLAIPVLGVKTLEKLRACFRASKVTHFNDEGKLESNKARWGILDDFVDALNLHYENNFTPSMNPSHVGMVLAESDVMAKVSPTTLLSRRSQKTGASFGLAAVGTVRSYAVSRS